MSIIEKAVEKLVNEPIKPNRTVLDTGNEKGPQVIDSSVVETDRINGHSLLLRERQESEGFNQIDDLEQIHVDLKHLRKAHIALVDEDNPRLHEELRMIKRRLLINASGLGDMAVENGNLIMVTSSVPDEGKTFIASNLALSITREIDRTVLLVDADVAKSDISKTFGLSERKGLTDYLTGDVELGDVLLNTDINGLTILPAGKRVNNSTELFSSNRMATLIGELTHRDKNRIVIFDSSPILATSEAPILANLIGQVAFVVRAGETRENEFISAIERLDHSKYVGLILNQGDEEIESGYYGYYQ